MAPRRQSPGLKPSLLHEFIHRPKGRCFHRSPVQCTFCNRAISFCASLAIAFADAPIQAGDSRSFEFFEKNIRPVLVERCYKCHSVQSETVKGGLLLDSREGLLKGGDAGPTVVPGNPEKSSLIRALRYVDQELQMPPKSRLTAEQVADLALGPISEVDRRR